MQAQLGSFLLESVLGEGAMGVVYRALHAEQRVPVAVKVDRQSADPRATAAFLHEIQITAALDHPNVVMLLDHGSVDAAASRASGGSLREGARWLAMEVAPGGTAASVAPRTWPEVLHLMRGTLAGLAHAHARGVVHRDIKLQNLLLAGDEGSVASAPGSLLQSRLVVSDFGVSDFQNTPALQSENPIGTPQFMAPELIEARWRDQGPWTDLYAIGVLLYLLTVRQFPFNGADRFATYRAHLHDPIPAFKPLMPVPHGLEELVQSLLCKAPGDRPEFAAEVQRALDGLGDPEADDDEATDFDEAIMPTLTVPELPLNTARSYAGRARGTLAAVPLLHGGRRRNASMDNVGLALFGLRSVPFVGREPECDRLWNALVTVRSRQRAQCVFVQGPSGIGKTRIADWVAQRTHELGVAVTLRTRHIAGAAPGVGLVEMLRRELNSTGLQAAELDARLAERFGDVPFDLRALAATLEPGAYGRPPTTQAEIRQLVLAVLSELSKSRPLVVILDDVQHDLAALQLIDSLLVVQELQPRPILVLATLQTEALVDVPEVEELLGDLLEDPHAFSLTLEPLKAEGRQKLVRSLLLLDGELAERVEARTAGNPLFAKQLLGAWIEQGVLEPGPRGFRLAKGHRGTLPSSVGDVWKSRLTNAIANATDEGIEALQIAAALGDEVVDATWEGSCEVLGVQPDRRMFDELRKRHLIHLDDPQGLRWRFVHGALRELLVASSRTADHWQRHNLGIAVFLRESEAPVPAKDRAGFFLEAGVWEEAFEPLCEAINDQIDCGDLRSPGLVNSLEGVVATLGLEGDSPEWAELQILKAIRHRARGELNEAADLVMETVALAVDRDWGSVGAKALREAARVLAVQGDYERALTFAADARKAFLALGDRVRAADCDSAAGSILVGLARYAEAEAALSRAITVFAEHAPDRVASPMIGMVRVHAGRGDKERMKAWLDETKAVAEPMGLQLSLAVCANLEGEAARAEGDLEGASLLYRRAVDRFRALESPDFAFPLINLGMIDVELGNHATAVQRMQPLLVHLRRNPHDLFSTFTHMVLMAALAGLGDTGALKSLALVRVYVEATGLADPDLAAMFEITARELRSHGLAGADGALALAVAQYATLGREEDVARLGR